MGRERRSRWVVFFFSLLIVAFSSRFRIMLIYGGSPLCDMRSVSNFLLRLPDASFVHFRPENLPPIHLPHIEAKGGLQSPWSSYASPLNSPMPKQPTGASRPDDSYTRPCHPTTVIKGDPSLPFGGSHNCWVSAPLASRTYGFPAVIWDELLILRSPR